MNVQFENPFGNNFILPQDKVDEYQNLIDQIFSGLQQSIQTNKVEQNEVLQPVFNELQNFEDLIQYLISLGFFDMESFIEYLRLLLNKRKYKKTKLKKAGLLGALSYWIHQFALGADINPIHRGQSLQETSGLGRVLNMARMVNRNFERFLNSLHKLKTQQTLRAKPAKEQGLIDITKPRLTDRLKNAVLRPIQTIKDLTLLRSKPIIEESSVPSLSSPSNHQQPGQQKTNQYTSSLQTRNSRLTSYTPSFNDTRLFCNVLTKALTTAIKTSLVVYASKQGLSIAQTAVDTLRTYKQGIKKQQTTSIAKNTNSLDQKNKNSYVDKYLHSEKGTLQRAKTL